MASYTVNRVKHATLTAGTTDQVTLRAGTAIEVANRALSTDLWFTIDGSWGVASTPTVAADDTYWVGAGQTRTLPVDNSATGLTGPSGLTTVTVRLTSSAVSTYSVTSI